jgi:hypothetical protein
MPLTDTFDEWLSDFRQRISALQTLADTLNDTLTDSETVTATFCSGEYSVLNTLDVHTAIWNAVRDILSTISNDYADAALTMTPATLSRCCDLDSLTDGLSIASPGFDVGPLGPPALLTEGDTDEQFCAHRNYDDVGIGIHLTLTVLGVVRSGNIYWTMAFGQSDEGYLPIVTQQVRFHGPISAPAASLAQRTARTKLAASLNDLQPIGVVSSEVLQAQPLASHVSGNVTFSFRLILPSLPQIPPLMTPLEDYSPLPAGTDIRMLIRTSTLATLLIAQLTPYADQAIAKICSQGWDDESFTRTSIQWEPTTGSATSDPAAGGILIVFFYNLSGQLTASNFPIAVDVTLPVANNAWVLRLSLCVGPGAFDPFFEGAILPGVADGHRSVTGAVASIETPWQIEQRGNPQIKMLSELDLSEANVDFEDAIAKIFTKERIEEWKGSRI